MSKRLLVCQTCAKHVPIGGNLEGAEYCAVHYDPSLRRCDGGGRPGLDVLGSSPEPEHKFVAEGPSILQGARIIARAISKTMAKRIANALNKHIPNREGV